MATKFNYSDLIERGFKENHSCKDEVFYNRHGYHYFFLTLKVTKKVVIEWSPSDRNLNLIRLDKTSNIVETYKFQSLSELDMILKFFK